MNVRVVLAVLALLAVGAAVISGLSANVRVAAQQECTISFDATVRQGPSAGWTAAGSLALKIDASGSVIGVLTPKDTSVKPINVVGQANGRAINLALDLGNSATIFGVGTLTNDIKDCTGTVGGPLVGPKPGDSGDWGYAIGG